MKFETPLLEGKFIKRYKRFFADIEYEKKVITAHVPNSGSMMGCKTPGSLCRFTHINDPKRKLQFTLQMIKSSKSWVGVNTGIPNKIVLEAWQNNTIQKWSSFNFAQREVKVFDKSRIDLVLWKDNSSKEKKNLMTSKSKNKISMDDIHAANQKFHIIEIKNVSLVENNVALFPDAVTTRGQKHLKDLMKLKQMGHTCELVFTIQRADAKSFSPAKEIDPEYSKLLKEAKDYGVTLSPFVCNLSKKEIQLTAEKLPIVF